MVIAWCWWWSDRKCPTPRLLPDVEAKKIVQHCLSIVSSKYVDRIFVCNHCMLAPPVHQKGFNFKSLYIAFDDALPASHKLIAFWHLFPLVHSLKRPKVQSYKLRVFRQGRKVETKLQSF